jgi:hypothetical protein
MIEQEIGELNGEKILYCQAESIEEARKEQLPEGIFFYWKKGTERFYSPAAIILMVQQGVEKGTFAPQAMAHDAHTFYQALIQAQKANLILFLSDSLEKYQQSNLPPQALDAIAGMMQQYKDMLGPDIEGVFTPSRKEAADIAGGEEALKSYYGDAQLKSIFGEAHGHR